MMTLSKDIGSKEVRRNNKYNHVVNLLVYGSLDEVSDNKLQKTFPYIKDLIIFAAMVGKRYNITEEVEKESTKITLSTFEGSSGGGKDSLIDQHNIIFMFGLSVLRDMKYMRDENIDDVIKVFERYSNGGLAMIEGWLKEAAWNPLILLDKIVDEIANAGSRDEVEVVNPF